MKEAFVAPLASSLCLPRSFTQLRTADRARPRVPACGRLSVSIQGCAEREVGASQDRAEPSILVPKLRDDSRNRRARERFSSKLLEWQASVCKGFEDLEDAYMFVAGSEQMLAEHGGVARARFCKDPWTRDSELGGGGITRVLQDGAVFEKAAVNVSLVSGALTEARAASMRSNQQRAVSAGDEYFAAALSIVVHPRSPMVPTLRGDVRVFELVSADTSSSAPLQLFAGGGADLTPVYLDIEDAIQFHAFWKQSCDVIDGSLYSTFKKQCDAYFYLPSRAEHRGVGGIFFDEFPVPETVQRDSASKRVYLERALSSVALGWVPSYMPIVTKHWMAPYGTRERNWQTVRRGRYLEFNLLHDRGVRFGLQSAGRMDAIMVSAPPVVRWRYELEPPAEGTPERAMLDFARRPPREWV